MKKKLILTMAVVMMLSVVLTGIAYAGTGSTSETFHGYTCYGYVSCTSTNAYALLSYGVPAGLFVKLMYTWVNPDTGENENVIERNSNNSTSVDLSLSGSEIAGAIAHFYVFYSSDRWYGSADAFSN